MKFSHFFKRFKEKLEENKDSDSDSDSLENYWNIPQTDISKIKIRYSKPIENINSETHIFFTVQFSKKSNFDFIELPIEISRYICEYLYEPIEIQTKIIYTEQFPFKQPTWYFVSVTPSYITESQIQSIVDEHNCNNLSSWSAAIQIERDFLGFFVKLLKSYNFTRISDSVII